MDILCHVITLSWDDWCDIGFLDDAALVLTLRYTTMLQFGIFDLSLDEIMLFFQDWWVVGWILIASGMLAAVWLLENITDPIPILDQFFNFLMAIGSYLGFFVGILDIAVGYVIYTTNPSSALVAAVLVIVGFSLSMRILSKFPLAFMLAAAVAAFATFTVYGYVKPYTTFGIPEIAAIATQIVSLKGLIIIFIVVFSIIYVVGGLVVKLIQLIGKVFSSTPVSVLVGLVAIGLGIVVLVAPYLLSLTAWT